MSPQTHRGITCRMMKDLKTSVLVVDYRLCPEHLFPSAISDVLAFYMALIGNSHLEQSKDFSTHFKDGEPPYKPDDIVVMGDSSGGCLTLQLLHAIRAAGLPFPGGAVLLSPFVDHS